MEDKHIEAAPAEPISALPEWSTYSLITAERILGKYAIQLPQATLLEVIKNSQAFYHHLLTIPSKNLYNGLIFQQAREYQVYAQKMFIDYLLAGENSASTEKSSFSVKEQLEDERHKLMQRTEIFQQLEKKHQESIAQSQQRLIALTSQFKTLSQGVIKESQDCMQSLGISVEPQNVQAILDKILAQANPQSLDSVFVEECISTLQLSLDEAQKARLASCMDKLLPLIKGLDEIVDEYQHQVEDMTQKMLDAREDFHTIILEAKLLIDALPEYKVDEVQDHINKEPLYFDPIG